MTMRHSKTQRLCVNDIDFIQLSPHIFCSVFKHPFAVLKNNAEFRERLGEERQLDFCFLRLSVFYLNAAALCDLRGCSVICCSGAFLVSVSLYYSLQTSPYSDPGSASFSSEEFPKCVSLCRSLSGGGFSCKICTLKCICQFLFECIDFPLSEDLKLLIWNHLFFLSSLRMFQGRRRCIVCVFHLSG